MNEVVDLSFVDRLPYAERTRAQHTEEIRREFFKRKLDDIARDAENAQTYCRDLMRAGSDVTEELDDLETIARGLLLVALLLRREDARRREAPEQFWTEG